MAPRQTAGSRARQTGKPVADVKAKDDHEERGQGTIYVDGKPYALVSLDDLSWGELAEFEDYIGRPLTDGLEDAAKSFKGALFLYYLARRREQPGYTLAEAESTAISKVSQNAPDDQGDDDAPPTSEAGA